MHPRYESTEHTADVGIKAYGTTLEEAFENAAFGLFDMMVDTSRAGRGRQVELSVEADDIQSLLVAFLNELLFIFETKSLVLVQFDIIDWDETTQLTARARGDLLTEHMELREHVKAVTYHDMRVERTGDGYEAEVLLDV